MKFIFLLIFDLINHHGVQAAHQITAQTQLDMFLRNAFFKKISRIPNFMSDSKIGTMGSSIGLTARNPRYEFICPIGRYPD